MSNDAKPQETPPAKSRFEPSRQPPLRRALRNAILIALVVGIVTHIQDSTPQESLMSALFTLVIVLPALWLSYRFTQKMLAPSDEQKSSDS